MNDRFPLSGSEDGAEGAAFAPEWDTGRRILRPTGRPLVMGVLNLTDDSFYPASRSPDPTAAVAAAGALLAAGADLLDVGAESCVFVDDLRPNIDAAAALGMVGVHHRDYRTTATELEVLFGGDPLDEDAGPLI